MKVYLPTILLLFLLWPASILADLIIEPYIGSHLNYNKTESPGIYMGLPYFGFKAGLNKFGLTLGTEANYSYILPFTGRQSFACSQGSDIVTFDESSEDCFSDPSQYYQPYHIFQIGISGAIQLPFIVNGYGSILFVQAINKNYSYKGIGLKGGISYITIPFFSLNLEVQLTRFYSCSQFADNRQSVKDCSDDESLSDMQPKLLLTGIVSISTPIKTVF